MVYFLLKRRFILRDEFLYLDQENNAVRFSNIMNQHILTTIHCSPLLEPVVQLITFKQWMKASIFVLKIKRRTLFLHFKMHYIKKLQEKNWKHVLNFHFEQTEEVWHIKSQDSHKSISTSLKNKDQERAKKPTF